MDSYQKKTQNRSRNSFIVGKQPLLDSPILTLYNMFDLIATEMRVIFANRDSANQLVPVDSALVGIHLKNSANRFPFTNCEDQ